ncbi:MAG: sodium/proton-translocating pyrophosphatase, partial [Pirellulaceae bacterium]
DNVGDVAGMGADLYESYCGSILATAALGVAAFSSVEAYGLEGDAMSWQLRALLLPMVLAGVGIFLSLIGINVVKTDEDASQKSLLKALATGINLSTMLVAVAGFVTTWVILGYENLGVAGSICVGLLSGWLIGKWTEYSTSDEFQPTRDLAAQAVTGPATVIISGVADGMKSVWVPVVVVCGATLLAFGFAAHGNFADVSHFALGLYGVGIAAVGMLSTLGITLATDAYGPIADNAGGNAEMAGLDPIVRERTDALDSLGNTTAATGKGFAIGSAALTALALMAAYIEEVRIGFERWADDPKVVASADAEGFHKIGSQFIIQHEPGKEGDEARSGWLVFPDDARKPGWSSIKTAKGPVALNGSIAEIRGEGHKRRTLVLKGDGKGEEADRTLSLISVKSATLPDYARYYDASLLNPKILVGVFLGCMTTFVFCAMTMKAVGRAAQGMVEEVRRQFREKPGIMDGSEMPDYTRPVAISTKSAQKEMIMPSLLGLCMPIAVGMLLGVGGVLGLLVGTLTCGFCLAVFMANAGGAWDNAKKYIEAGNYGGKGSEAHKAGVVGDTVGDPFKDTSGPSLNILIKLMSMVSVVAAGLIVRYSLTAMGIF